jgi:hypothetical protein
MKNVVWGLLMISCAASAQQPVTAFQAVPLASTDSCLIPKLDGERVPFPLKEANTKFELSDGQTYLLNGTLTVDGTKVLLKIDFVSQPWLATPKMLAYPYMEVTSMDASTANQYSGKLVQIAVVANVTGEARLSARTLSPILPPVYTSH